jgi:hypothetical protein
MYIITKSGLRVHMPTPEEDAAINAGIAADSDSPEWTEEDFAAARPAREVLPAGLYAALIAHRPPAGKKNPA